MQAERRNDGPSDLGYRLPEAWIGQVLEPKVDVLGKTIGAPCKAAAAAPTIM